jgi:hypothetical protein
MNSFFYCLIGLLLTSSVTVAQSAYEITEDKPTAYNGIEYGFAIRNQSEKTIGDKGTFARYELTVYATNKSGCTKLFFPRQTLYGQQDQDLLANYDCLNANGMRMTSKGGQVKARPFMVPYQTSTKNAEGKTITSTIQVQAGHWLRNGETVSENFIVIVPPGERPQMRVRVREFID